MQLFIRHFFNFPYVRRLRTNPRQKMPSSRATANEWQSETATLYLVSKRRLTKPKPGTWLLWFALFLGCLYLGHRWWMTEKEIPPGIVVHEDGSLGLSPDRQAKLDRELEEIDHAIQYALIAGTKGVYPCYSCPNGQNTIFLNFGEVWKYGITRKGAEGRYPQGNFGAPNLLFVQQFTGTYSECLKMERVMIYGYPMLPQASARDFILIRPPGNRYDS